jgi:hypothetical protein
VVYDGTVGYSIWLIPNLCLSLFAIRLAVVGAVVEFDMFMNEFTALIMKFYNSYSLKKLKMNEE